MSDGELLAAFAQQCEEAAFAELVARHGGMVLAVCRAIAASEAEDAAQAVFLALAQKAASLQNHKTVAGWLHRVASYIAANARRANATRRQHEQMAAAMKPPAIQPDVPGDPRLGQLHESLATLPEKYRTALILHHLEGHTQEQTAALVGCSPVAAAVRLNRGRKMLRDRLVRCGAAVSTLEVAALLAKQPPAVTPAAFVTSTAQFTVRVVADPSGAGVSALVITLAKGGLRMLRMERIKNTALIAATVLLCIGLFMTVHLFAQATSPHLPTRSYDIRLLIMSVPDFSDAPDLGIQPIGSSAATQPAPPQPTRAQIVEHVLKRVREVIPDAPATNVTEEKGILHVTASDEDLTRVASAIARWKTALAVTITVQTRLLVLDRAAIAKFDPGVRAILDDIPLDNSAEMIDAHQQDALLNAAKAAKDSSIITEPQLTLFQDQRAYSLVAKQQAFIGGIHPETNGNGKKIYKPVVSVVDDGVVIDVRASAVDSTDESAISLDYRAQFATCHALKDEAWIDPTTHARSSIQVPNISKESIRQLLAILPRHGALVRLADPAALGASDRPAGAANEDCFAIITAKINSSGDRPLAE